ncbi:MULTISPECIES: neutral zinc metallopeptidase [Rhodomicrobium]|uniref:neutral zinc metallopeptidase n=1 Tax=Rhodomicrobium TaxID=1068 RepID=UPI000F7442C7|nr:MULTISPECIES: neutral zinc metallopeptidase [Rhodomicrobium]
MPAIFILSLSAGGASRADEADAHGPRLHNPFCSVATFVRRDILTQAQARIDANGRPVIYINPENAAGDLAYRDFLMAHECCHHTRGHLQRLRQKRREQALLDMSFVNRSVELDADCCAGVALARANRRNAIREAVRRMQSFGAMPTGAGGYPAGDMRATLIRDCAAGGGGPER